MRRISLPKDALTRIDLGKAFAEHDLLSRDPSLFVKTPASVAALDENNRKSFYVGRRGAGKTAIALQIERTYKRAINIAPQVFDLIELPFNENEFLNTNGREFKSISSAFKRALVCELISLWIRDNRIRWEEAGDVMRKERGLIESCDFDFRVLNLVEETFEAFNKNHAKAWLRQVNRSKQLIEETNSIGSDNNFRYAIIIDRMDDAWSGSNSSIISLMALMHASLELASASQFVRPFIFLRENIYDRIRSVDNEFSRLETSASYLDWSEEKLVELVERRCIKPFNTKPKIGGEAWMQFFREDETFSSREDIFKTCQHRPRDLIMLTSFAFESAINKQHLVVEEGDIETAKERYSSSRLKDLGDEYAENFPNISVVLGLFYGLAKEFTLSSIEELIKRLMVEDKITKHCKDWFFDYTSPHRFIELLYSIGFMGVRRAGHIHYRDAAHHTSATPKIDNDSTVVVHGTYRNALKLSNQLLSQLPETLELKEDGILEDIPNGLSFDNYKDTVTVLLDELRSLPFGHEGADQFEQIVGEIIKLCFFRSLTNVEPKVRSGDKRTIKDWIASNHAAEGFWQRVREKHGATQVIWECKNYEKLHADDFHQASYYMNDVIGHFSIIAFRGREVTESCYGHVNRIMSKDNGLVLLLRQNDLEVFLRQAIKGSSRDAHISELYDKTIRNIC